MKKLVYLILAFCTLTISCGDSDDQPVNTFNDCPTNLVCTEVFVSLVFSPRDNNNQPISLVSFYTQNLDNGNTYTIPNNNSSPSTQFPVITDGQLSEIQAEGTNIRFIGLIDDQIVVQQDFVVGHDCCHVTPISGPFDQ